MRLRKDEAAGWGGRRLQGESERVRSELCTCHSMQATQHVRAKPARDFDSSGVGEGQGMSEQPRGAAAGPLLRKWRAVLAALSDPRLSRGDAAVFAHIAGHADNVHFIAWPGMSLLAREAAVGQRTVVRSVGRLEALGYVEIVKRGGPPARVNHYRLTLKGATVPSGDADDTTSTAGAGSDADDTRGSDGDVTRVVTSKAGSSDPRPSIMPAVVTAPIPALYNLGG